MTKVVIYKQGKRVELVVSLVVNSKFSKSVRIKKVG
jgi:hypothetical protein